MSYQLATIGGATLFWVAIAGCADPTTATTTATATATATAAAPEVLAATSLRVVGMT